MEIKKCINGHYFDVETYKFCPHCGESRLEEGDLHQKSPSKKGPLSAIADRIKEVAGGSQSKTPSTPVQNSFQDPSFGSGNQMQPEQGQVFEPRKRGDTNSGYNSGQSQAGVVEASIGGGISFSPNNSFGSSPNEPQRQNSQNSFSGQPANTNSGVTLDYWSATDPVATQQSAFDQGIPQSSPNSIQTSQSNAFLAENSVADNNAYVPKNTPQEPAPSVAADPNTVSSARDAVAKASTAEEGKTLSFFSLDRPPVPNPSADSNAAGNEGTDSESNAISGNSSVSGASVVTEPCAGWLVCVKGPHFGQSFPIFSGRNSLGRKADNRVAFPMDPHISRERHAWVIYEPRKRVFNILPGDGSGLTYLNEENLLEAHELKAGDMIEIGNTTLRFLPLCGPDFSWEDYMKEE